MLCSKCKKPSDFVMEDGLCQACHVQSEVRRLEIIDLAREQHPQAGVIEIHDNATLSEGNDNGCYVAAWVWVEFAGTKFDKERGNTNA